MPEQVLPEQMSMLPHSEIEVSHHHHKRKRITLADLWQISRFGVVGSLNAVIDFVVLDLLLNFFPTTNTGKILLFNSLAVLLASTNSFFWNKYWTFQNKQPITLPEIGRFAVIAGATATLNDILMFILAQLFPGIMSNSLIGANVLKLAAIIGTTSVSFFGMRLWVFFQKKHTVTAIAHTHAINHTDPHHQSISASPLAEDILLEDDEEIVEPPLMAPLMLVSITGSHLVTVHKIEEPEETYDENKQVTSRNLHPIRLNSVASQTEQDAD